MKDIMNKEEPISQMCEYSGMDKSLAEGAIDTFCDVIKDALENQEEIEITGFGKFKLFKDYYR
jgi:nucleoid DNA-binding protein